MAHFSSFFSLSICFIFLYCCRPTAAATLAVSPVKRGDAEDRIQCPYRLPNQIPRYLTQYPSLLYMCARRERYPMNLGCTCAGDELLCGTSDRAAVRLLIRYCFDHCACGRNTNVNRYRPKRKLPYQPPAEYDEPLDQVGVAPRNDIYLQAVERGQAFWAQLSSNRYTAPITGGNMEDLGFQGWEIKSVLPKLDGVLTTVLERLVGMPRNQYYQWRAEHRATYYLNLYGPKDGVIAALDNVNRGVGMPMSNWSEITWRIWADTCESVSIDPKTLKYIIRHQIANGQTIDIIDHIYDDLFPHTGFGNEMVLLPSGRTLQAFQALLGSPNGRGVAWMLLNKRNVLGKTIAKATVEIVHGDRIGWDMWFELQEVAVAPSSAATE